MQHLSATDDRLQILIHTARGRSEANHPTHGNFVADVLDALAAYACDGRIESADALLDAATALHMQAEDTEEISDPTDDRYDQWREDRAMGAAQ